ncbi:MAG: translation elongation factor-like protein [bacterium]|nr:translation elongation factor-like protein [bacterium]
MAKKKLSKKSVKKVVKKTVASKSKPVGVVTHFYNKIKVAIVKFKKPIVIGATIAFRGHKTDFEHKIVSMQLDHEAIKKAPKGKQIGIKVGKRVREGDGVFTV